MSPQIFQLKTGQIIRCCNYPSIGASSESAQDKLTGKVFLAGSVGVTLVPKDWIIDSTNKRIYSIDFPESLVAGIPKFYGSWQPKDENGDVISEIPLGITTDATYLYISFSDGKIRKYTTAGVIQQIVSGVYYRDFGIVFNTLGKGLYGVGGSPATVYLIDLVSNTVSAQSYNLWNSRNETYAETPIAVDDTFKYLISANKFAHHSSNLIQQWEDWNNTKDIISMVGYSSTQSLFLENGYKLSQIEALNSFKASDYTQLIGYYVDPPHELRVFGEGPGVTGFTGAETVGGGYKGYFRYITDVSNAEASFIRVVPTYLQTTIPGEMNVFLHNWYPADVSDYVGGSLIKSYPDKLWESPLIFEIPVVNLSGDFQCHIESPNQGTVAPIFGFFSLYPGNALYIRKTITEITSLTLPTQNWTDFTLR